MKSQKAKITKGWISVETALPVCDKTPFDPERDSSMYSRDVLTFSPLHGIDIRVLRVNNKSIFGHKTMGKTAKWHDSIDMNITHWHEVPKAPMKRKTYGTK